MIGKIDTKKLLREEKVTETLKNIKCKLSEIPYTKNISSVRN